MITEKEIQIVRNDLIRSGVDYAPLRDELIDHIITDVEKFMLAGKPFDKAYAEVKAYLDYKNVDFNEVQNDTKTLLDYKSRFLKVLTVSVFSISLVGFGFKFYKLNGGSMIQLLSFFLLSALFFRFSFHFFRDKRDSSRKKMVAILFGIVGLVLPITYILYLFFHEYHIIATKLNMISFLLLSLSVLVSLKAYQEINIFGIGQETRKSDLFLVHFNIVLALLSVFLNIGEFHLTLNYLLYVIIGINAVFALFLIITYRFTNRLTTMLVVSVLTMHVYHLPNLIR
jgi:hypothetical protein